MTRRRKMLLVVLLLAVGANLVWLSRLSSPKSPPDFRFDVSRGFETFLEPQKVPPVPVYDPRLNGWTVDGKSVTDLLSLLTDSDPEDIGPDSIGKYLIIRLPHDAGGDVYRQALADLAEKGICQVALWDDASEAGGDWRHVKVLRLVDVRDDSGAMIACVDRVNTS